jgi:hypothetical protein
MKQQTYEQWREAVRQDLLLHCPYFLRGNRRALFYGLIETAWIGKAKPKEHQRFIISKPKSV